MDGWLEVKFISNPVGNGSQGEGKERKTRGAFRPRGSGL
jgi:hypothetical protein